jgi:hypothetical protein
MDPLDWNNTELLRERSDAIARAVDAAIEGADTEGYRTHLGASIIGRECLRYLYYHFHWMHRETFSGRELRVFNAGHRLEPRIRYWLTQIGFQFVDGCDENNPQVQFRGIQGHFGGSADGVFIAPSWGILEPTLLECKTSGTGAGFNNLDKGIFETKPEHYIQDSVYGKGFGLTHCLYVAENKNDSDWKFILVKLNEQLADEAIRKAEFIILEAQEPPKKISHRRNFFVCGMCKMQGICHDGKPTDVNCRSCRNSKPIENAQWYCNHWNAIIPPEAILTGCGEHNPIQR